MSTIRALACIVLACLASAAEMKTKVTVYEGPQECDAHEKVKKGDYVGMHYVGKIDQSSKTGTKGLQFDSSYHADRRLEGDVFYTVIGTGQVITGWDKGLVGLCKGAKAKLVIPPEEGYGKSGAGGDIPGGATLNFDVKVMSVNPADDARNEDRQELLKQFKEIDVNSDGKISKAELDDSLTKEGGEAMDDETFGEDDLDGDGTISWEEWQAEGMDGAADPDDTEAESEGDEEGELDEAETNDGDAGTEL